MPASCDQCILASANLDVHVGESERATKIKRFFPYAGGDAPRQPKGGDLVPGD